MANKKNLVPGPGAYTCSSPDRVRGLCKQNEEKGAFIDNAKYVGSQTPGYQYNPNQSLTKPRIFALKYYASKD
jgi:hypothetical protein